MGIYNISDTAYAGLQIAQAGMLVTSQNVAGSSVDGFSKRTANATLDALAPNSLMLNGTSFAVNGFTRSYSALLGSQILSQQSKSSYSDTLVQYTQSIDSLVSDQNTGLTSALSTFFNAMGTYAADPTSQAAAGAITSSANDVATRLTGMTNVADQLLSSSKAGLTGTVQQVNTLLPELASINAQITAGTSPGNTTPSADLLDERDRILASLQKLVGGQSLINSDGTATQLVNGIPLVERGVANKMTISSDQTAIAVQFNSKSTTGNPNGQTLQTIDGGQAGALLQVINGFVPSIQQRLNAIAIGLVKVANSAGQSNGQGSATNVPIFGFKVGSSTFASLQSGTTDPTGALPNITSDEDLNNFYNSLKNVITSTLTNGVTTIGSFSKVSSIFADTRKAAPNTYTLSQVITNGVPTNQVTLTPAPVNGVQGPTQTVTVANGVLGSSQSVNFSQYGIALNISNPAGYVNTGIIGLNSGQIIGNQTVTSVIASGAGAAAGGYQIVAGSAAGKVKLSGPNGYLSADVTLTNGATGGQLLDFGNGIKIELADNGVGNTASTIASQLVGTSFVVGVHAGATLAGGESIGSIATTNSAQPGAYQLTADASGNLTIAATINGSTLSQTIAVADMAAGGIQTLNFANLGISLTVNNGATALTAQNIAQQVASTSPSNQVVIAPGIDTGLDLAGGLNGQTFSVTSSTNSAVTYGLTAENFVSLAPSNPSGYMNGTAPYITSAAANTVANMFSVFGNAVSNLVSDVGTKVSTWTNNQKADSAVLSNLQTQSNSVSGVNLDEEAANLLKYQQLYSAASKVLQTGNQMFSTLLAIMN